MSRIIEMLTVNVQVRDMAEAVAKVQAMGLEPLPLSHMPGPPAYIDDVSVPFGTNSHISLITPNSEKSQINDLLEKRGPGLNSLTVRVEKSATGYGRMEQGWPQVELPGAAGPSSSQLARRGLRTRSAVGELGAPEFVLRSHGGGV